jgi:hypothetical protein
VAEFLYPGRADVKKDFSTAGKISRPGANFRSLPDASMASPEPGETVTSIGAGTTLFSYISSYAGHFSDEEQIKGMNGR